MQETMYRYGNTSSMFDPGAAGHTLFFGGTFVAIKTRCGRVFTLAYKLFAVAISIRKRGIDEVQAEFKARSKARSDHHRYRLSTGFRRCPRLHSQFH